MQAFLGICDYYQRFVKHYAEIVSQLYRLLNKSIPLIWNTVCKKSFSDIKKKLIEIPSLNYSYLDLAFHLHCDASDHAIGAVISRMENGTEKPISFFCKTITSAQRNYCTSDRECLALVSAIKTFRYYLNGNEFHVYTDHHPLVYLQLEKYCFEVFHIPGNKNTVADGLSRSLAAIRISSNLNMA
ncbi:Retrovirus-related Pol polyprotein [Thelohanellus kitauei]|uniref:Retrovirus-related Pol polyprotein n=1 Tax=Thelohanellus kitauei TaxID=669202 RepID=A0A0C2MJM0_THEKT|nr:Retrovirus-related Pol polyprotein [Thelohanellus kitauei]